MPDAHRLTNANLSRLFASFRQAGRKVLATKAKPAARKASDLEARIRSGRTAEEPRAQIDRLRLYYGAGL